VSGSVAAVDVWAPPPDGTEWMRHPGQRANYLAALERHNEHAFSEAVDWLRMWRAESMGSPAERTMLDERREAGTADLIAELVRVAHDRRQLGAGVAASFKDVAAAVGISAERLAEAVRAALQAEQAA
jgi:hypothetical protein